MLRRRSMTGYSMGVCPDEMKDPKSAKKAGSKLKSPTNPANKLNVQNDPIVIIEGRERLDPACVMKNLLIIKNVCDISTNGLQKT